MNRTAKFLGTTLLLTALTLAPMANAQLAQTWDIQARNKAERSVSAGVTLLTNGKTLLALVAFEKATQFDPSDATPYLMLGMALAKQGRYQEALHSLQKAYAQQKTAETLVATGIVYYLQHDYDAAITSWNRALELSPKLCQLYGDIGMAMLRKGNFTDAEQMFQRLVTCRPSSAFGYQGIATVNYLRGNFTAARAAAERAQLAGPYAPVTLALAKLDALQGDRLSALKRALLAGAMSRRTKTAERPMTEIGMPLQHDFRWDPFRVDSFDNGFLLAARMQDPLDFKRQAALAQQGNVTRALESTRAMLAQSPNDLFLLRELALAQMAAGDFAASTETFRRVVELYPHCSVDLLHIGRALAMQRKGGEGSIYIKEFVSHVPNETISPALANIGSEPEPPVVPEQEVAPAKPKREKVVREPKVKEPKVKQPKVKREASTDESKRPGRPTVEEGMPANQF